MISKVIQIAALLALATVVLIREPTVNVAAPRVSIEPAPAPIVPPAQVVVTPPPAAVAPPSVPEPTPEPAPTKPPPRLLAPKLQPTCALSREEQRCAWHDGLPAISGDGSRIALWWVPSYTQADSDGLWVRFVDTATHEAKDVLVFSQDEYTDEPAQIAKRQPIIAKRIAAIQATLDEGHFRALEPLAHWVRGDAGNAPPVPTTGTYADVDSGLVRIVDADLNVVIAQDDFSTPGGVRDEGQDCSGWFLREMGVSWDPETRTVLTHGTYRTGGCMCGDDNHVVVKRLAR